MRLGPDARRRLEGLALLAAPTLLGLALEPRLSLTGQAMLYLLAVTTVAYRSPWGWSAGFALAAVTALNFFFVPPRFTLEVESREYLVALAAMLAVALLISRLAARSRAEAARALRNERHARRLQALTLELAAAAPEADLLAIGERALRADFASVRLVLADAAAPGTAPSGRDSEADALACCVREAAVLGPGTFRWPGLDAWYVPLRDGERALGAACLRPASGPDVERREQAEAVCAVLAQALSRARLATQTHEARQAAAQAASRSMLLAGLSHDLRTPLAVIAGAASALQAQGARMPEAERERLLGSIVDEARHLAQVADNTLQVVRLAEGGVPLSRDWQSVEEIVGSVLARVRSRDPERRIRAQVPGGLPLLRADALLVAQALENLLDNALAYSGGPVELAVARLDDALALEVKDRGPGLDPATFEALCAPFARGAAALAAGRHGLGIGLAACRAIAEAHGGHLAARPRRGGGSSVRLTLPLEPVPALPAGAA